MSVAEAARAAAPSSGAAATTDVVSFGCRLNAYESEAIREHLAAGGLEDVIVFNTCAVTAEAERQARQQIRRAKRARPDARVVVTGCAAQIAPETWAAMPEVEAGSESGRQSRPEARSHSIETVQVFQERAGIHFEPHRA